jgi:hypothetical protein
MSRSNRTAQHILFDLGFELEPLSSVEDPLLNDLGFEPEMPLDKRAAGASQAIESKPALQGSTNQIQPIGAIDADSGRLITQPSDNPVINQALAADAMREYRSGLKDALKSVPGAKLAASRTTKNPKRLAEKIEQQGQPAETVNDYGAAQVAVDSPQARDAVVAAVKRTFPVLREEDEFAHGDPQYGYRCYSMQVQMSNGVSQELQIVPNEVFNVNQAQHRNYKHARETELAGRYAEAIKLRAKAQNDAAMKAFNKRNGPGTQPALSKGATVTLPDGSQGKISYLDSNLGIVRVRTDEGKNLTIRRYQLRGGATNHAGDEFPSLTTHAKD